MKYNLRRQEEEGEEEGDSDCEIQQLKQKIRLRRQQIRRSRLPPCATSQHSKATLSAVKWKGSHLYIYTICLSESALTWFFILFYIDWDTISWLFKNMWMCFLLLDIMFHQCNFHKYTSFFNKHYIIRATSSKISQRSHNIYLWFYNAGL